MKKARKGFTLIELLIVVAIMGSLAAMMASSSADSIDNAAASAIINNLQTMKTAAYDMYMNEPAVAGLSEITKNDEIVGTSTVEKVFGKYLGRINIAEHYGIVGDTNSWYVYYELQDSSDSTKVKAILAKKANAAGILGAADATLATLTKDDTTYFVATDKVIALRVR